MNCPQCGLMNPPTAVRCDCGYDFAGHHSRLEGNSQPVSVESIRYPGERAAFIVLFLAATVTVAGILAFTIAQPAGGGVLLFYILLFFGISWLAKVLALAGIRGNGIRVSSNQYPELYAYVVRFAGTLGLTRTPEVYVVQQTLMNAFATKAIGSYVVLYSHLVDAALESG